MKESISKNIMLLVLQYLVAVSVIASSLASQLENRNDTKVTCPPGFITLGTSNCYFFSPVALAFNDARVFCRSMMADDEGVDLAVLGPGNEEFGRISNYMQANGLENQFIGVNDEVNDGDWIWVDGTALAWSSTMWYCEEPWEGYEYNCGVLNQYTLPEGYRIFLSTLPCESAYQFICEYGVHTLNRTVTDKK